MGSTEGKIPQLLGTTGLLRNSLICNLMKGSNTRGQFLLFVVPYQMLHAEGTALVFLYPKPSLCDHLTVLSTETRSLIHHTVLIPEKNVLFLFLDVGLFFGLSDYRFNFLALSGGWRPH